MGVWSSEASCGPLQAQDHWAELYSDVAEDAMVWEQRFPRLIADIACHMPAVLNLQEVDRLEDFQRHLGALGCEPPCPSANGPV